MASADATVRLQALDGGWETLGADRLRGVTVEALVASANEWGPDQMGFQVKAEPGAARPDLLPFTPIELELDGIVCWAGRVKARPAGEREHQVQCEGWQYHLTDDLLDRMYVHTRMSEWRDQRSLLGTDLAVFTSGWQIQNGEGQIEITLPNGAVSQQALLGAVVLDLGPTSTAKRVVLTLKGGGRVNFDVLLRAGNTEAHGSDESFILAGTAPTSDTTYAQTFTSDSRYVRIGLRNLTGGNATGDDTSWIRVSAVKVFRATAYESGNASILEADEVIRDALPLATLLNQSTTLIADGDFSIPEYLTSGHQTPREIMEAVNAYQNRQLRIAGADLKTLEYREKPSSPLFEVGDWSGSEFSDASISGQEIYDEAIIDAAGPDGARLVVTRSQTGTLVDRRGFHRARVLPIRTAITQAVAERFGDLWLPEHKNAPFAGKLSVRGNGVRRVQGGASVPPHVLLLHAGEKIRLAHRVDPDTGAWGRDGRIAGVTYTHDDRKADVDIDDRRDHFEKVLARYGVLADQIR